VDCFAGWLMMRKVAIFAALLVAACNKGPATRAPDGPIASEPGGPVATGRADANNVVAGGEAKAVEVGTLPPPGPALRFVGQWAADQRSCDSTAWTFTATSLRTPAGSSCSFDHVSDVPGGYDILARCTAEGPSKPDTLKIRFAESAKAMLFSSKSIADTGLVFCGRAA
jgi:hypothetical protein